MNDAPDADLDADALGMLDAFVAHEQLPPAINERVWARLQSDVAAGVAPIRSGRSGRWLRRGVMVAGLAAAAVALWWMGGRVLTMADLRDPGSQAGYDAVSPNRAGTAQPREPSQAVSQREASTKPQGPGIAPLEDIVPSAAPGEAGDAAPHPPPPIVDETVEDEAAATVAEADPPEPDDSATSATTPKTRPRSGQRRGRTPTPSEPEVGRTLADENRLLGLARTALIRDQPERALARLATHAKRFPDGVLAQERQALRAVALCEAGHHDRGAAAARSFLAAHPGAALASRVRSTCLE